jgi:hypothetical protein
MITYYMALLMHDTALTKKPLMGPMAVFIHNPISASRKLKNKPTASFTAKDWENLAESPF